MKPVRVVLSPAAGEVYTTLLAEASTSKRAQSILKAIRDKTELIKANRHYGDPIAKRLIPREFVQQYAVSNLFRVELPSFWRMLYTLTNDEREIEIVAFVLDIGSHKDYDKTMGYRGR